jgi:eukaryotic-like serine/threonine-protein kinase
MKRAPQAESAEASDAPPSGIRAGDTYSGRAVPAGEREPEDDFLAEVTGDAVPCWLAEGADAPAEGWGSHELNLEPGTVIAGRYRLSRFIARGGMGEVYEAFDSFVRERVALKMILPDQSLSTSACNELVSEVRLARRITHPNVCRIHDLGLHGDARRRYRPLPFLSMEFIEGETLGDRLRSGPLPAAAVRAIARQLLLGLGAAHSAGVLHGDLKSDNVMLRRNPSGELDAVITDFGLARAFEAGAYLAQGGSLAGSVDYMAPEQLLSAPLGRETDLFAFGVVLFEMLTGRLPFSSGGSPISSAIRRLQERPALPSRSVSGLPPAVDAVVFTCLRRERRDRYPDAAAALRALEASGLGEPPRAAWPSWRRAFERWPGWRA